MKKTYAQKINQTKRKELLEKIEDAISEKLLSGEINENNSYTCEYVDNAFVFNKDSEN